MGKCIEKLEVAARVRIKAGSTIFVRLRWRESRSAKAESEEVGPGPERRKLGPGPAVGGIAAGPGPAVNPRNEGKMIIL